MTGLREYRRDLELPARLGDAALVPPSPAAVADSLAGRLAPELGPAPEAAIVYARWKPGVATTACYRLSNGDDERLVVVKLHVDGKAADLARGDASKGRFGDQHEVDLRLVADGARLAWSFPADRELPGAARVLDIGRFARFFAEEGIRPGWRVRRKHFASRLVRYRPEARAVFELGVKLEGPNGEKELITLGARALRRGVARRVIAQRKRFERGSAGAELAPALRATELRAGLLYEDWLPVAVPAPDDFEHAERAGALLARLHRADSWDDAETTAPHTVDDAVVWLERLPELARAVPAVPVLPSRPRAWVHGDFHPDQVGLADGGDRLLDLDRLGAGEPADDLAEWVADALADDPTRAFEDAAGPLLDAYVGAGGERPATDDLALRVAGALVRRAAAGLRRLEVDAAARADDLLARARRVLATEVAR